MVKIKICGIRRLEDIRIVNMYKPDYIGFVFAPSKRRVSHELAAELKASLDSDIVSVGVFVDADCQEIVGLFEEVVSSLTLIVCFQSLILSMAGNVGTQSLAVTIRVLMDEQISGRESVALIFKELRIGFFNGTALGAISAGLIGLYIWLLRGQDVTAAFVTSGCIGLSMMVAMTVSSLTGTLIPMLFKKIKVDPAVASGPLITTINDLVAVVAYYGLAWLLLINLLA